MVGQPTGLGYEILADEPEWQRQRRIYRNRTVAMLRRYMRYAMETGRLPSLLGREFFRSKVTSYTVVTFEDRVIFVHDMETCLEKLDEFSRRVLARIVLQEYEHEDAAQLLGCTRMTVHRKLIEALDALSGLLLEVGLLERVPNRENPCQGGNLGVFSLSDCEEGK
jgi:DNA-directed RNA polymerase specialized sigma24 family protein